MRKLFIYGLTALLTLNAEIHAQEVIDYTSFEQAVLEYSQSVKQSQAQQTAMRKAMQAARTSFFPAIDASGSYQYRVNDYDLNFGSMALPMEHDSYSADVTVSQPVYAGGNIYHTYKAQQIQSSIADKGVDLTTDNVIYAAENSYWGAVAQRHMYLTMCRYTDIVNELVELLRHKYDDGLISKTDLIQMEARLSEARLQQSNSYENYRIALQNMNILMGKDPMNDILPKDSISTVNPLPELIDTETALTVRPDYAISSLNVDYQKRQVKLAAAKYNPSLSVGFQETWGTQMLNLNGDTRFNSTFFVSAKIPLVRWGARFKSTAAQRALLLDKQYAMQDKRDQISKEIAGSWTRMNESAQQISHAIESCRLAEENLDLNTFSYTEGKLTVLDVLSAQLTWIQAYTNLIQTYYKQKISIAEYRKATGMRYMN